MNTRESLHAQALNAMIQSGKLKWRQLPPKIEGGIPVYTADIGCGWAINVNERRVGFVHDDGHWFCICGMSDCGTRYGDYDWVSSVCATAEDACSERKPFLEAATQFLHGEEA